MELAPYQSTPQQFVFADRFPVRAFEYQGDPYFFAADLCKALEYSNTSKAISDHVDDEDRAYVTITNGVIGGLTTGYTLSGNQQLVVNESGMYALIFGSIKPEAREFKHFVTSEVLPTIRKTGAYVAKELSPAEMLVAMAQRLVEQERINAETNRRLSDIELRQTAMEHGTEYFSVLAFAKRIGRRVDNTKAQNIGKHASRYSRKHGYPIGEAPDTRFGTVHTYHEDVLRAVFGIEAA
jgi:prophage antirepressor-like protein